MDWAVSEELIAQAIGQAAMRCMEPDALVRAASSAALELLEEIRSILNDETLDDRSCFYKIDALVSAFHKRGIDVSRHDFG